MPTYEYRCRDCRKRVSIYQTYEEYGSAPVSCPNCGGHNLKRLINRVRIAKSEESRLDDLSDPSAWGDIDENDPKSMAKMMRKMSREMGEDVPPEFDEVVDRLESGQSPEEIEQSLPDLGAGGDDLDF
ncbi:MAG: zinc ribbon domain-containing protein [Anaerolineales bacterium]|jgi:putative FmdB family regulatory protein